ncbi:MAG TPA: HAD family hydrolase [Parafilimonas sp.]|nr:HAD family hydrolase [Parafilimonas sp.]
MNKAVFIDRDGTLIKNVPYNANPALIEFLPDAIETLSVLKKNKFLLILISNQSGVARGFFSVEQLEEMHDVIQQTLSNFNVKLNAIYYCPHHPEGKIKEYAIECKCRKPKPGLILKAATKYNIDLNNSWMVGDILNDVEAGNAAGCKTILLDNGNETEWIVNEKREPAFTVESWRMIAQTIVSNEKVILKDG